MCYYEKVKKKMAKQIFFQVSVFPLDFFSSSDLQEKLFCEKNVNSFICNKASRKLNCIR